MNSISVSPNTHVSKASIASIPKATKTAVHQPNSFHQVLHGLAGQVDRGERVVNTALRASPNDETAGMIALQAGVYKYVEAVELCTKLVDRSTAAVKTTLQSQ